MKYALPQISRGTAAAAPDGSAGSDAATSNKTGGGEPAADRPPSPAFAAWLADYCGRLEQFVRKNAGRP